MGDSFAGNGNIRCNRSEGQVSSGAPRGELEDKRGEIISASSENSDCETPTYKLYSMSVSFVFSEWFLSVTYTVKTGFV